ncbi:MAG TPA: hypothetical protein PK011_15680, partial [Marinagarivorans sp.]|nr:hypothetical protein [Marinagarivorans sp.]
MSKLVDIIKLVTVNTALGYGFNATAWAMPLNNFGVQKAINRAKELGIPVGFFDARYKMSAPAIPAPGLSYVGQPARYKIVGDIPDSSLILDGGTIFECDPGVYAFEYNAQGRANLPASNFASDALTGCTFKNLHSIGGSGLMAIGSKNMIGAVKCHFEDIGFQDASDWGIRLWNFQQCTFGNRTARNAVPGGGIQYGFDIPHRAGDAGTNPLLLAGNSTDRDRTFVFNSHFAARGVEIYVAPGSQLNQINFMGGGQVNRFGGNSSGVDMTLIFNNSSPDVGFVNPAHYDLMVVGGAFQFKAGAVNWWEPTATHYVVSKNDANKTVQLSEWMYGTARTASQTINTIVMTYGGHPGLSVCGSSSSI